MKTLLLAFTMLLSTLTLADECVGEIPDLDENQSAMVTPAACAKKIIENGSIAELSGIYLDAGNGLIVSYKKSTNKDRICQGFGYSSAVPKSAVITKQDTFINRQGMLVPGVQKVITSINCNI